MCALVVMFFFFFKQKTAYEMRISDWSSDVCSSDLHRELDRHVGRLPEAIVLAPVMQDACDGALPAEPLDEVVQDHPLVVPHHRLACLGEEFPLPRTLGREHVADRVVKLHKGQVGDRQSTRLNSSH